MPASLASHVQYGVRGTDMDQLICSLPAGNTPPTPFPPPPSYVPSTHPIIASYLLYPPHPPLWPWFQYLCFSVPVRPPLRSPRHQVATKPLREPSCQPRTWGGRRDLDGQHSSLPPSYPADAVSRGRRARQEGPGGGRGGKPAHHTPLREIRSLFPGGPSGKIPSRYTTSQPYDDRGIR